MTGYVGLLITGNEVLHARTRDTNSLFLARELRKAGILVQRTLFCADLYSEITQALEFLGGACETVLVSGGLGPTGDDLTCEAVAGFLNLPLQHSAEAWKNCLDYFEQLGRKEVPESNRKQALLPAGSRILPNPRGTAVGFDISLQRLGKPLRITCLPGVPHEMEAMFLESVLPTLVKEAPRLVQRSWQVFRVGESLLQQKLGPLETNLTTAFPGIAIGYQASQGCVTWSLASGRLERSRLDEFSERIERWVRPELKNLLGSHIIYEDDRTLPAFVCEELARAGLRLALAESCTGGRVAQEISALPGASRSFNGAAVVYSNESKSEVLGVERSTIERFGAVSTQTAREMAEGARVLYLADIGLGITGVAGPDGGTHAHPSGCVCFAMSIAEARMPNPDPLARRLATLGWTLMTDGSTMEHSGSYRAIHFVTEQRFGSGLAREVVQIRATVFALGSLAAALNEFVR